MFSVRVTMLPYAAPIFTYFRRDKMSSRFSSRRGLSRREFLRTAGGLTAAAAFSPIFPIVDLKPSRRLSGELKILMWSHFVPAHDKWFDPFAKDWGDKNGVKVTVDHINNADIPAKAAAEIAAGEGNAITQYNFPPPGPGPTPPR